MMTHTGAGMQSNSALIALTPLRNRDSRQTGLVAGDNSGPVPNEAATIRLLKNISLLVLSNATLDVPQFLRPQLVLS